MYGNRFHSGTGSRYPTLITIIGTSGDHFYQWDILNGLYIEDQTLYHGKHENKTIIDHALV